jgi:hypothetical protein
VRSKFMQIPGPPRFPNERLSKDALPTRHRPWTVSGQLQDVSIQLFGDHPDLRPYVEEFIAPFVGRDGLAPADKLEFSLSLRSERPKPSVPAHSKALIQFVNVSCFQDGLLFSFRTKDGSYLTADIDKGRAWGHLTEQLLRAPRYVFTDLLMAPLMEMLKKRGFYGLHAAALTKEGAGGYLFPGGAGSGKTTIALSLIKEGFQYLADDKVLLRNEGPGVAALAFTRRFNIDPDIGLHYPELSFLENLQPLPKTTKRPFDISSVYPDTFVSSCRPKFLIHLQKTSDLKSRILHLSSIESFRRLVQQTIPSFHRDIAGKQLRLFADLARRTEGYLLFNGKDLYESPKRLLELLPPYRGQISTSE